MTVLAAGEVLEEPMVTVPADGAATTRWDGLVAGPRWPWLTALVSLPLLVVIASRWGKVVVPVGDLAITDLAVRDVAHGHLTLLGPYSRYGWNHPGPAMFVLMAPFQWLSGGAAWGTIVGANVLKIGGIALSIREGERLGGKTLATVVAVVLALAYGPLAVEFVVDPWNPWIAVVYLPATVLSGAAVLAGHRRALLTLVFSVSLMVESHVGFIPLVLVLLAALVGLFLLDRDVRRRVFGAGPWRGALVGAALMTFVFWVGPVWDVFFGRGNVQAMVRYFTSDNPEELVGWHRAQRLLAVEFHPVPPWLGGPNPRSSIDGSLLFSTPGWAWLALPLVLAVAVVALRARRLELRVVAVGVLATVAAALIALTRVTMPVQSYLFPYRSMIPLALLAILASAAWIRWSDGDDRSGDSDATMRDSGRLGREVPLGVAGSVVALVLVLVPSIATSKAALDRPVLGRNERQISVAGKALRQTYDRTEDGRPVVVASLGFALHGWDSSLLDELDRVGIRVLVPEDQGFKYSDRRAVTPEEALRREATTTWWIIEEGDLRARVVEGPDVDVIYRTQNLPEDEQRELDGLYREFYRILTDAGQGQLAGDIDAASIYDQVVFRVPDWRSIVPERDLRRLADLNARAADTGCQCAVVATPIGTPAPL